MHISIVTHFTHFLFLSLNQIASDEKLSKAWEQDDSGFMSMCNITRAEEMNACLRKQDPVAVLCQVPGVLQSITATRSNYY